tara:strand:+ start:206 stop:1048 length:843 start_codon:yes stop_codon:yes gene_type:complete
MPFLSIVIIAIVQGITEFLPISSSGHLLLTHWALQGAEAQNNYAQNHLFDIAVHVGTLLAVLLYFRKDVLSLIQGALATVLRTNRKTDASESRHLFLMVILASLPVILAGLALQLWQPAFLNWLTLIAITNIVFGLLLYWADQKGTQTKSVSELTLGQAFLIGVAQIFALAPGTSRSGVTMTAGLFFQLTRAEAARFSLLLAIIAIAGAGTLGALDLMQSGDFQLGLDIALAAFLSFLTAYAAIFAMMKWLERATFTPFVIYRIAFGIILLILIQQGVFA